MATQSGSKAQHDQNIFEEEKHQADATEQNNAPDIESAAEFLHGDVTEVESDAVIDAIGEWVDFLKGHKTLSKT